MPYFFQRASLGWSMASKCALSRSILVSLVPWRRMIVVTLFLDQFMDHHKGLCIAIQGVWNFLNSFSSLKSSCHSFSPWKSPFMGFYSGFFGYDMWIVCGATLWKSTDSDKLRAARFAAHSPSRWFAQVSWLITWFVDELAESMWFVDHFADEFACDGRY